MTGGVLTVEEGRAMVKNRQDLKMAKMERKVERHKKKLENVKRQRNKRKRKHDNAGSWRTELSNFLISIYLFGLLVVKYIEVGPLCVQHHL